MNRFPLFAALVGALLAVAALFVSQGARNEVADLRAAPPAKDPALEKLSARIDALTEEVRGLREGRQAVDERVGALERDLALARQAIERQAQALEAATLTPARPVEPAAAPDAAREAEKRAAAKAEFDLLRKKVFSGEATAEESERFWELARTSGALAEVIQELAQKVEQVPADVNARMQLAQAYLAKLLSVPDGPERGTWAMRAEGQWQKVLELDGAHWEARYSLAVSWSYWPEQFNKTPDAIRQFEMLREQQTRMAPDPEQANVYLTLAMLYRKMGNHEKARGALEEGLARHAGHDGLKKALEAGR